MSNDLDRILGIPQKPRRLSRYELALQRKRDAALYSAGRKTAAVGVKAGKYAYSKAAPVVRQGVQVAGTRVKGWLEARRVKKVSVTDAERKEVATQDWFKELKKKGGL